ncbi:MAG: DEAD/DEAH box helicase [Cellulosilyticaceae bacterium]
MESILFDQLNLSEEVKKAIVDMGFEETTPIQAKAIPHMLEGKDMIAQAPTGTGKTCAFGVPAIESIDTNNSKIQVLILCPTRELVIQTAEELRDLCKYKENVRALPIYGGQPIDRQIMALKKKPQIIIGTPGRVMDHLRRKTLRFDDLKMVILDEADEMLNMGFREDIDIILESVPGDRQFVLFSATLPKAIMDIANKYQTDAVKINVVHKVMTVSTVEQFYLEVREANKVEILSRIIDANNFKLSVVFCNTKKRVDDLCKALLARGYSAEALHGDMKQIHRDSVMGKFRSGLVDILIATDVAARGIDVDDVGAVFNYDVPTDEEYYVHRIGRTGRAKRSGVAYTFAAGREVNKLKEIQRYTKSKIALMKPPSIEDIRENKIASVLEEVKAEILKGKLTKYAEYVENIVDDMNESSEDMDISSVDVAAALIRMSMNKIVMGSSENVKIEEVRSRASSSSNSSYSSGSSYDDSGNVRLFINLGKKDKLQPSHLVKLIASSTSLEGKNIGKIDMLDKFSFFEIPEGNVQEVMDMLTVQKVKGRKINIEVANKK